MKLVDSIGIERFTFLHVKNGELNAFKKQPELFTNRQVKNSFDHFYREVCSWKENFPTHKLSDFQAIGYAYDGFTPGTNKPFLGLYQELMNIASNPLSYQEH